MKNIFNISEGITEMPIAQQKKKTAGYWDNSNRTLPTMYISKDTFPSFDFSSFNFPSSIPVSYGGGGGGGGDYDNNDSIGENVNDPYNALNTISDNLKQSLTYLKESLKTGNHDPSKVQNVIDSFEKTLKTIELMKDSNHKYRIDIKENFDNNPTISSGEFSYDKETNEYVITIEGLDTQYLPTLIHELEHVDQFENGEVDFDENGIPIGYDMNDEVDAYQQEEYFKNGILYNTVTPEYVKEKNPGIYDNLPNNKGTGGDSNHSISSYSRS